MGTVEVVPQPTKSKTSGSKIKLFMNFIALWFILV